MGRAAGPAIAARLTPFTMRRFRGRPEEEAEPLSDSPSQGELAPHGKADLRYLPALQKPDPSPYRLRRVRFLRRSPGRRRPGVARGPSAGASRGGRAVWEQERALEQERIWEQERALEQERILD